MKLYKYYPDNIFTYRALSLNGLWCHYPKNMNDPFECLGYSNREISDEQVSMFKSHLNSNSMLKTFSNEDVKVFINEQRKKTVSQFAFCSLSENYNDIKMWSHYASEHKGFVIEFYFDDSILDHHFQKVNYVTKLPEFDVIKLARQLNGDYQLDYLLSDISLKSKDWIEECEYRIWRPKPTYFHYKIENVKRIFFGIRCSIETKAIIAKLFNGHENSIEIFDMVFVDNPISLSYS